MPNFQEILDLLNQVFPNQVKLILTAVLILVGIWWALDILSRIKGLWVKEFSPLFYSAEEKRRVARRRRFADHIESEVRRLNNLEAWSDYRFAELEAEVEAEGRQRTFSIFPLLQRSRSGLRREKSLSRALETSQERLILVEGEPGSGKSVALRHVAQSMARKAMKARTAKIITPIYINLKELKPNKGELIDRNLIQAFVLKSLNRANDRDIEEFLENEFDQGLQEGTWLFLFDSFDEIPDVLSSTEADAIIRNYSDAISDFLHGLNLCRGIVASRQFRGPGQSGWPRFRILQLSETRRAELVRKADLGAELQNTVVGQLGIAGDEIRGMVSNPMFLGLLCEYMKAGNPFPQNAHSVFETYVETRLNRDQERLERRFKLKPSEIRATAENVAFCMAADQGLGLTPTRENIVKAMKELDFRVPKNFISQLDALEYIKLARSETATAAGDSKPFTFAHRRFQEYFATCIVLREPKRVAPRLLLTDARWRETTVVICQTQPANLLLPIIKEARKILTEMKRGVPELIDNPMEYVNETKDTTSEIDSLPTLFPWPAGLLHFAGLLQDGFFNRLKDLPDDLRLMVGQILLTASKNGTLSDQKWALEIAGTVPSEILIWLLRDAFASDSQWLSEVAFRQTARLNEIPDDISRSIRQALVRLFVDGHLKREQHTIYAHISRLDKSSDFVATLQLLLWPRFVEVFTQALLFILLVVELMEKTQRLFLLRDRYSEVLIMFGFLVVLFPFLCLPILYLSMPMLVDFYAFFMLDSRQRIQASWSSRFGYSILAICAQLVGIGIVFDSLNVSPLLKGILFLLILWVRFALAAALTGQFTRPIWWGVMSVWPLFYIFGNAKKVIIAIADWLQKNWKRLILLIILTIPMTIPILLIGVIITPIFYLLALPNVFFAPIYWIVDWIYLRRRVKILQDVVTIQEFHQVLVHFHFNRFRNRFVKTIREQGLFAANDDTETYLIQLALAVEHALMMRKKRLEKMIDARKKSVWGLLLLGFTNMRDSLVQQKNYLLSFLKSSDTINISLSNYIEVWQNNYEKNNKERLAGWGVEFLDETWMLSEQIHANRKDK